MADDGQMGYDKASLYWAGKHFFPQASALFAQSDRAVYGEGPAIQSASDWVGDPAALGTVMALCDTLQAAMKRTSQALERIGENLVTVADNFEAADEQAARSYKRQLHRLETDYPDKPGTTTQGTVPKPFPYQPTGTPVVGD